MQNQLQTIALLFLLLASLSSYAQKDSTAKKALHIPTHGFFIPDSTKNANQKIVLKYDTNISAFLFENDIVFEQSTLDSLSKITINSETLVLSLTSSDTISPIQPEGNIRNVVIVQSKDSSNQARHDFLIAFHKFYKTEKDIEIAYHKALAYIEAKYGAIEFEHSINIRE